MIRLHCITSILALLVFVRISAAQVVAGDEAIEPNRVTTATAWAGTFVGEASFDWPFRTNGTRRVQPPIRYNRVEGVVVGVRRRHIEWDSYERARVVGQAGYSFGRDRLLYDAGVEGRVGKPYGNTGPDVIIGVSYRDMTVTNDLWKSTWLENTLGGFFFNQDFFDYYGVEGFSGHLAVKARRTVQLMAAVRIEDHLSLERGVTWSLFGGDGFRENPRADEGSMHSLVLAVDAGDVSYFRSAPSGFAFRAEAEIGSGLGGDFSFNRYLGEARMYRSSEDLGTLALRVLAGLADGTVPRQKLFTVGGIGTVRGLPQNILAGSRTIVVNTEYWRRLGRIFDGPLEEVAIGGFFDTGWANYAGTDQVKIRHFRSSAGLSLGLHNREVRVDIALPLESFPGSDKVNVWLRIAPTF